MYKFRNPISIILTLLLISFLAQEISSNALIIDPDVKNSQQAQTEGVKIIKLPRNYSIHEPPPLLDGEAVQINFSIVLFNVFDIKELQGDLSLEANLKIYWKDTRLANWTDVIEPGDKYTVLNPSLVTQIWHPDAFIDHLKGMSQPSLISKAASLRIYPDGSLRYSARMLIVMSCHMNFIYYPADTQECQMDLKSYAYSTDQLTLGWKDNQGPTMAYPILVHNFDVAIDTAPDYLQETKSASYSAIRFTIFLRRKLSFHIFQTFIPSALFTIVSWLSFLVPPESTPGRMALCVTTLLTLTAMFASVRQNTPSVSYIKALDWWMVTCIIFVFSVLAEYTVVLKLRSMKEKSKKSLPRKLSSPGLTDRLGNNFMLDFSPNRNVDKSFADPLLSSASSNGSRPMTPVTLNNSVGMMTPPKTPPPTTASQEDKSGPTKYFLLACKFETYTPRIMPLVFLLFNCIYWPYLLISSDYYNLRHGDDMYYSVE